MARALRAISIKRGVDTREHLLVSFGGAGGLHVCELAEELGMRRAMVPVQGGALSALGMLAAQPGRQLSRTLMLGLDDETGVARRVRTELDRLRQQAAAALATGGIRLAACKQRVSVDLRYRGQSYTLNLPWQDPAATVEAFHRRHARRYGHRLDQAVELVTLRLGVRAPGTGFALPDWQPQEADALVGHPGLPGVGRVPLYRREGMPAGFRIEGPALIAEQVATTWLAPAWQATMDSTGNLLLERTQNAEGRLAALQEQVE